MGRDQLKNNENSQNTKKNIKKTELLRLTFKTTEINALLTTRFPLLAATASVGHGSFVVEQASAVMYSMRSREYDVAGAASTSPSLNAFTYRAY